MKWERIWSNFVDPADALQILLYPDPDTQPWLIQKDYVSYLNIQRIEKPLKFSLRGPPQQQEQEINK